MKTTCLIVEDSLFIRELYRICLSAVDVEIVGEAVDGIDAVIKMNSLIPDIVLLDLVLPEKNGFDVLSECAHLKTKFIIISSLPADEYEQKAKSLGAPTGGDIKIHGLRNDRGYIHKFHRWFNWTNGCIAVTNTEMEGLYQAVPNGTKIEIKP